MTAARVRKGVILLLLTIYIKKELFGFSIRMSSHTCLVTCVVYCLRVRLCYGYVSFFSVIACINLGLTRMGEQRSC